ncbi:MAG: flagella basal body P-ring formation protein FlgA [Alphaproteobacteria bacterium]|nr:MAG: flagella basal body P-ring formation protein FlgA [Alphaproteobacteria bacterium]
MKRVLAIALALAMPTAALADTVVAARTIRAQSILQPGDVALVAGDLEGTYASLEEVIGQESRVALYGGRPIRINEIGPPAIVDRNQIVTLIYSAGGLSITAEGRSLSRAGIGDRIRVINLDSRQVVTGWVNANATVSVGSRAPNLADGGYQ